MFLKFTSYQLKTENNKKKESEMQKKLEISWNQVKTERPFWNSTPLSS